MGTTYGVTHLMLYDVHKHNKVICTGSLDWIARYCISYIHLYVEDERVCPGRQGKV